MKLVETPTSGLLPGLAHRPATTFLSAALICTQLALLASGCGPIVGVGAATGALAAGGGTGGGGSSGQVPESFRSFDFQSASGAAAVAAKDLDGDGRIDVVITTKGEAAIVQVFRNESPSSDGTVDLAAPITLTFTPYVDGNRPPSGDPFNHATRAALADLDGDGRPEIAVASGKLVIYRNLTVTGTPAAPEPLAFAPALEIGPAVYYDWVCAADMNGDGRIDLVTLDQRNRLRVLLNETSAPGAPTFTSSPAILVADPVVRPSSNQGHMSWGLEVADLNQDGRPDIFAGCALPLASNPTVPSGEWRTVVIFNETPAHATALVLSPATEVEGLSLMESIAVGDFTGDGRVDLVLGGGSDGIADTLVRVFESRVAPGSTVAEYVVVREVGRSSNGYPRGQTAAGYLNGDGEADLVLRADPPGVIAFFGARAPAQPFGSQVVGDTTDLDVIALTVADIDADGWSDVLVVGERTLRVLRSRLGDR